jgi:hypothetical protein
MWDKIQVVAEVVTFFVAVWLVAATCEPLRSRAFGRPVGPRLAMAIRVTAALAAAGALAILLLDIFFR